MLSQPSHGLDRGCDLPPTESDDARAQRAVLAIVFDQHPAQLTICELAQEINKADFLPTLASLAGAPHSARADWQGVDYSKLVLHPSSKRGVQDYVVFTYDDYQSGQKHGPYPKAPNHIVSIREGRWKLAKYYDAKGRKAPQWEMYDLKTDPLEKRNLAFSGHKRTPTEDAEFKRLKRKLARVEKTRLKPLSS